MDAATRIKKLREAMLTTPEICIERGLLLTESYKETESEPVLIRRAKAFRKILNEMSIAIQDDELIVGMAAGKPRAGVLTPELNSRWYLNEMELLSQREWDRFKPLSEEDKNKMREFLPYWRGKSLFDRWNAAIPPEFLRLNGLVQAGGAFCGNNQYWGHAGINYEKVLRLGLVGIAAQADEEIVKLKLADVKDFRKFQFYEAVKITLEAAKGFARRYAALAAGLAAREKDGRRKQELEKIAEICGRVPAGPAQSFREAVQATWFTFLYTMVEGWGTGTGFLRADQYLYPFYQKDMEAGKITREEALELIALLLIKMNGLVNPYSTEVVRVFCGFSLSATITLGGLTKDGKDAVNELSYLFLEAEKTVGLNSEDIVIRVHQKTPEAFLIKGCEVAKTLCGKLKFVSDETIIQQLLHDGKTLEDAREYAITGCNTPTVPGRSIDIPGGITNLPLMLELALNNGVSRLSGKKLGPQTGDPKKFQSYGEVWNAFKAQVEALIPVALLFKNVDKQLFADYLPSPFQSALYDNCMENGLDLTTGGTAPYISHAISLGGAPDVGDGLAAIKKVVFEDKKIAMARLIDALDRNFAGEDELRKMLLDAPKYGNNDEYVDSLVNDVLMLAGGEAAKTRGVAGAVSSVAAAILTANIPLGAVVGALPDGRKAAEALAEGGISPHQGRNRCGPTATMLSAASIDHVKLTNGSVLNMRFSPDALQDQTKIKKFAALVRTYLETGGSLVQFNMVNTETLIDAQKHPEKYKDLLVRVATYSSYFVELSPELQDDIIARMEFREV